MEEPRGASGTAYLDMFPGYYSTADAGMVDADGYVWVMARTDDIINCAAIGCPQAPWKKC